MIRAASLPLTHLDFHDAMEERGYSIKALSQQPFNPSLLAGANDLAFIARFGDDAAMEPCGSNIAVTAALRLQGDLRLRVVNRWTIGKRFARWPQRLGDVTVEIAATVIGGMTTGYTRILVELCDQLMDGFLPEMKAREAQRVLGNGAPSGSGLNHLQVVAGINVVGSVAAADGRLQIEICDQLARQIIPDLRAVLIELVAIGCAVEKNAPAISFGARSSEDSNDLRIGSGTLSSLG